MDIGGAILWGQTTLSEAEHSPPSTEVAKNGWIRTTTSPYSIFLYGVRRDKFTFIDIVRPRTCVCVCVYVWEKVFCWRICMEVVTVLWLGL
jgi:hypothetical protein